MINKRYLRLCVLILSNTLFCVRLVHGQPQWNPGFNIGTVSGKYECQYGQSPGQLVEIHDAAIPNTGLTYHWFSSPYPTSGFTPVSSGDGGSSYTVPDLTQNTYYRRETTSPSLGTITSNIVKITVVSSDWADTNYLREYDVRTTQSADSWHEIDQLAIGKKQETTTYIDGLGRPLQNISKGIATPTSGGTWGDVVEFHQYDNFGREPKHYLPYSTTTTPGKYKETAQTDQPQYYSNVYNETSAFTNETFDNSPLNRATNVKESGTSWATAPGNSAAYDVNSISDSVQLFSVDYVRGNPPTHNGMYPPNSLYKVITTDENGKKVITYTDKSGQLILKKAQLSNSPSTGHWGWICIYNIYDDFGLLRYTLQPNAVDYLNAHSWSFAGTAGNEILNEQVYAYDYDDKGRVIWKKAPGQQPQQLIYDIRDRVVFTQDGNQAVTTTPQWTATLYDELDRPTLTAQYNTSETRDQLQADVDNSVTASTITISNGGGPITDLVINNRDPSVSAYKARNSISFVADAGGSFTTVTGDSFTAEIDPNATTPSTTATVAVYKDPIPSAKLNDPTATTILKYQFYDNYSYTGAKAFATDFENSAAYSSTDPDVVPTESSKRTTGFATGSMTRILGTPNFLASTQYYDEKGQLIQTLSDNIKQGTDVTTLQYHFDGRLLSVDTKHSTAHTGYNDFHILTKYLFDQIGRANAIQKKIETSSWKTMSSYEYDDMGRLKIKHLDPDFPGGDLESLNYSYNIHNEVTGINKDYALKTPGIYNKWSHYFGMYLGYDNQDSKFNTARLDGHITGQMWNTRGDDAQRKYDYTYDNPGRLTEANFTQFDGSAWNTSQGVDYTVNNISYDDNGNLSHMNQSGLKLNSSSVIDNLSYTYQSYSNKLSKVIDAANDANSTLGDFHYGTKGTADYTYDEQGNLTLDANKKISSITYNYLDLPDDVSVTGKGTVKFIYDADGNKLQKIVTDNTVNPIKTATTSYINGFVYNDDTLEYFPTEEGRIRPIRLSGQPISYTYDYFIQDNLGNVRTVVTEQTDDAVYAATMEDQNAQVENSLFDNISNTTTGKPTGFDNDSNNKQVSQLDGSQGDNTLPRTGPTIVLKVMAGDTITMGTYAWYQGTVQPPPNNPSNLLNDLLNALSGGVIGNSHGLYTATDNNPATMLSGDLSQFFSNVEDVNYAPDRPKAFLNWIAFDNQLNTVASNSGLVQVPIITGGAQAEPLAAPQQIIQKNGYIYIYVSNESAQKVFFDNLIIHHHSGHLQQEEQYYPFGLTMAAISSTAAMRPDGRYKYNNKELNHKEFNDLTGIEWYDLGFRNYDPQIARFLEQDPLTNVLSSLSSYQYAANDPIANIDLDGLDPITASLPSLTVIASAVPHTMIPISGSFASELSKIASLTNTTSVVVHGAQMASDAINGVNLTKGVSETHNNINIESSGPEVLPQLQLPYGPGPRYLLPNIPFKLIESEANYTKNLFHQIADPLVNNLRTAIKGKNPDNTKASPLKRINGGLDFAINLGLLFSRGEGETGESDETSGFMTSKRLIEESEENYYDQQVETAKKLFPQKANRIELHHITPKYLGGDPNGPLVPLDAAYHQLITNEFRSLWPYGMPLPSPLQLREIMLKVYLKYPLPLGYSY